MSVLQGTHTSTCIWGQRPFEESISNIYVVRFWVTTAFLSVHDPNILICNIFHFFTLSVNPSLRWQNGVLSCIVASIRHRCDYGRMLFLFPPMTSIGFEPQGLLLSAVTAKPRLLPIYVLWLVRAKNLLCSNSSIQYNLDRFMLFEIFLKKKLKYAWFSQQF